MIYYCLLLYSFLLHMLDKFWNSFHFIFIVLKGTPTPARRSRLAEGAIWLLWDNRLHQVFIAAFTLSQRVVGI